MKWLFSIFILVSLLVIGFTSNVHIRINQQQIVLSLYSYFFDDTTTLLDTTIQNDLTYVKNTISTFEADRHWSLQIQNSDILKGDITSECTTDSIKQQLTIEVLLRSLYSKESIQLYCDRTLVFDKAKVVNEIKKQLQQVGPEKIPQYWVKGFVVDKLLGLVAIESDKLNVFFQNTTFNNFSTGIYPKLNSSYIVKGKEMKLSPIIVDIISKSDEFETYYQPLIQQFTQSIITVKKGEKVLTQFPISRNTLTKYIKLNSSTKPLISFSDSGFNYLKERLEGSLKIDSKIQKINILGKSNNKYPLMIQRSYSISIQDLITQLRTNLVEEQVFLDQTLQVHSKVETEKVNYNEKIQIHLDDSIESKQVCQSLNALENNVNLSDIFSTYKWDDQTKANDRMNQIANLLLSNNIQLVNTKESIIWAIKGNKSEWNPLSNFYLDWFDSRNNILLEVPKGNKFLLFCEEKKNEQVVSLYNSNISKNDIFGPVQKDSGTVWTVMNNKLMTWTLSN